MKRTKYLLAVFIGTFVYVLLSVFIGQNGLHSFKQMEEQKRVISKQASDIQNINSELKLELAALQNDKAVIAAYARKLDYVTDDEKLVKITGLKPAQTTLYDTGTVIHHVENTYLSEKKCKMLGLFFFLLSLIICILSDISNGNIGNSKKKKALVAGIPIYDVPQI